nr:acyltransferase [uncultured Psychroserpens sp.]
MKRLPNLDVLRFFLSVYVVLIHLSQTSHNMNLPNLFDVIGNHKGDQAIAMFFVLSGFLIITIIYRSKLKGTFSIRNFYMRRILKIFPLYYFIVAVGFLYYHFILPKLGVSFPINYDWEDAVLLNVFFLPNVFSRLYDAGGVFEVLWSIGVEEQFYIIIAPLLFFLRKTQIFKALLVLTVVYFIVFHIDSLYVLRRFKFEFFFIFSGGLIALLEQKNKLGFLKSTKLIPIASVIMVILYFFTTIFDFETLWIYNAFTCILFSVFIHSISINNFGFTIENKYLNYFGEISYGLYLYHILCMNLVLFISLKISDAYTINSTILLILMHLLTFAITIFVSHLSYKYFESYFLKLKTKFR